jgi:hypothetical protein
MAGWNDTVFQWLGLGRYTATAPSLLEGQAGEMQVDQRGRLRVVTAGEDMSAAAWADTTALTYMLAARTSAGSLYQIFGSNEGGAKRWVQVFDSTTLPANGTIPKLSIPVDAGKTFSVSLGHGRKFTAGIRIAVSSTAPTLTVDTGALFWMNAEHGS